MAPSYYCLGGCTEKNLGGHRKSAVLLVYPHKKAEVTFSSSLVQYAVYGMGFGGYFLFLYVLL